MYRSYKKRNEYTVALLVSILQFEEEDYRVFLVNSYADMAQHVVCEVC